MNSLSNVLKPLEVESITSELEHLFFAQNEMLTPEKKNYLLKEITESGYPVQSIIAALKKLQHETIKHIKLGEILSNVKEHYAPNVKYESSFEMVTETERHANSVYIAQLKERYGKDWFRNFGNYSNYRLLPIASDSWVKFKNINNTGITELCKTIVGGM